MIKSHLRRRHSLIVAYFTLNRKIKKRRGRKNSRIPRENIEEDHYEGKSTTWTHTQLSSTPTFLWPVARAYGDWERERKKGGIIRDTARTRPRRANKMIGDEKGAARRRWFCWCKKGDPPLRIALKETDCVGLSCPPPLFVWPAVHKSSALDKSRKKMKGIN